MESKFTFRTSLVFIYTYIILKMLLERVLRFLFEGQTVYALYSLFGNLFLGIIVMIIVFAVSLKNGRAITFQNLRLNKFPNFFEIILVCIAAVSLIALNGVLTSIFNVTTFTIGSSINFESLSNNIVLAVLLSAVVPAIWEEIMFRGVIFQGLASWNIIRAVFISALLFGFGHIGTINFISAFIFGILSVLVLSITGNLWLSIIIHFLNNLFVTLNINIVNWFFNLVGSIVGYGLLLIAVLVFIMIICLVAIKKIENKRKESCDNVDLEVSVQSVRYSPSSIQIVLLFVAIGIFFCNWFF